GELEGDVRVLAERDDDVAGDGTETGERGRDAVVSGREIQKAKRAVPFGDEVERGVGTLGADVGARNGRALLVANRSGQASILGLSRGWKGSEDDEQESGGDVFHDN